MAIVIHYFHIVDIKINIFIITTIKNKKNKKQKIQIYYIKIN